MPIISSKAERAPDTRLTVGQYHDDRPNVMACSSKAERLSYMQLTVEHYHPGRPKYTLLAHR